MNVRVSEVMTCGVETVSSAATLEEAGKKMRMRNVGMLPVVDDEKVVGVVTDRDIVLRAVSERMRPEMTRVREVMTRQALYCYEDQDITEASLVMEKHFIHRLVVLNRKDMLVGVVSLSDIAAKTRNEELSGHVLGMVSAA